MERTYDELTDEYQRVLAWIDRAYRTLRTHAAGSAEGAALARAITAGEGRAAKLRYAVRNHPDSPPQG